MSNKVKILIEYYKIKDYIILDTINLSYIEKSYSEYFIMKNRNINKNNKYK